MNHEIKRLKSLALVVALLSLVSAGMSLAYSDEQSDLALKTCANERYSINNPKECG